MDTHQAWVLQSDASSRVTIHECDVVCTVCPCCPGPPQCSVDGVTDSHTVSVRVTKKKKLSKNKRPSPEGNGLLNLVRLSQSTVQNTETP